MADSVTLAYLHTDDVSHSWHHSIVNLLMHDASTSQRILRGGYIAFASGYDLERSRNRVAAQFLDSKQAEWLLWTDSDMGFAPDALERLLAVADPDRLPVVGGLCFGFKDLGGDGCNGLVRKPFTTMFRWQQQGDKTAFSPILHYPPNTLVPVDATGAAFVIVHRKVLEAIRARYGDVWYSRIDNPTMADSRFGEDISFCIRAKACGFAMAVHTGVRTNHHKQVHVGEAMFWQDMAAPAATEPTAVLVPVMRRPQNAEPFMRTLRASTGLAAVYAIADPDDVDTQTAWKEAGAQVLICDRGPSFAQKINYGYEHTAEPWLFVCGDDVAFRPGWLDHAQHTAAVSGGSVIGTNDLGNPRVLASEHATHLLIRRSYVDELGASWDGPGVVAHEGYRHWYVDDELVTAAKQRGVWAMALGSVVEHLHPKWGKATNDDVYAKGQRSADKDGRLFKKRRDLHAA